MQYFPKLTTINKKGQKCGAHIKASRPEIIFSQQNSREVQSKSVANTNYTFSLPPRAAALNCTSY